jgi:hypothetical protein
VEECTNKISELGAIPNPEMISKYMAYTQKNVSSESGSMYDFGESKLIAEFTRYSCSKN